MVVPIRTAPVKYDVFKLQGGLDLITPTLSLPPGVAREAQNFEVSTTGGYSRIAGYERFDGRTSPDTALYTIVSLSAVAGVSVGNTIQNSGATVTGVVIAVVGNNVLYTKAVGTFSIGTTVYVGATPIGTVQTTTNFSPSSYDQAVYTAAASDVYRADIGVVPGSGAIRGVAFLGSTVYAWRNNVGNTAMAIYKSTSSGWTAVALGFELAFDSGTGTAIAEGNTVTGFTSGATGVVSRVVVENGTTWSGASGRLILSSTTGTFVATEHLYVAGSKRAHCVTPAAAITLAPSGRVETVTANMGGSIASTRLYGADGVNKGFEFDGTVYVPIRTGMADDTPDHVAVQKNYLFFSFGPSVQNSSVGAPYVWSPVLGTNELVVPENVTCMQSMPGDATTAALGIYTKNNTHMLYGVSSSAWNLVPYDKGTGAAAYTAQTITDSYSLDDRGVMSLSTTRNYGNFDSATLTFAIRPFVQVRRGLATASGVNREKSQYRVFYSDGYGLYVTIANGKLLGSMPVYFPNPVTCWCEGETGSGEESSYFGSTNGYVYKLDTGPDFDGQSISSFIKLNFNAEGMSRVLKRYRRASLEMIGSGYASFNFGYLLGYESTDIDQAGQTTYSVPFSFSQWDYFIWDQFVWDGRSLAPGEVQCDGTAENIAVLINSNSRYNQPFTINSVTLHYTPRRGIR
jgi:hypothetical protein